MDTIYCNAETVIAWLGNGYENFQELFDFVQEFCAKYAAWLDDHINMWDAFQDQPEIETIWKELYFSSGTTVVHWERS